MQIYRTFIIFAMLLTAGCASEVGSLVTQSPVRLSHELPRYGEETSHEFPRFEVLYSFLGGEDGANPSDGVTGDKNGALFGVTESGGAFGLGEVYKLAPSGSKFIKSTIYSFQGGTADGAVPIGRPVVDSAGNVFGTTGGGGLFGDGTVYRLMRAGSSYTESIIFNFSGGAGGLAPDGALTLDARKRSIFGTTPSFPNQGNGTVFKVTGIYGPSPTQTVLHIFTGGSDGINPRGGVYLGKHDILYGVTCSGGAGGYGTIFSLTASNEGGYNESVLYAFNGGSAKCPLNVVEAVDGTLFGPAGGGFRYGLIFKLRPVGKSYDFNVPYEFLGGHDGADPESTLDVAPGGHLLGTTFSGGSQSSGVVYDLTPAKNGRYPERVSWTFHGSDGDEPSGHLFVDASGDIYGTALQGGTDGCCGTVFRFAASKP